MKEKKELTEKEKKIIDGITKFIIIGSFFVFCYWLFTTLNIL